MRSWPWSDWSRPFFYVLLCALFLQFGVGMQRTLFNNFVTEEFGVGPDQLGWLESVREIPGLLTFALVGLTVFLARNALLAASVTCLASGLALYAASRGISGLILATLVYSVGFHFFMPLQSAQALELTDSGRKAKRLGDLNSVSAFAGLLAMGFVYLVSTRLGFRQLFLVAALVTLGGAVVMILLPRARAADKPRGFVVRRRYLTYYGLTFLASSRRQIATTFAVFALVKLYGTPVRTIALLMLVSNVVAVLTRSLCGRLVDRLGESLAMQLGYGSVVLIFLCYAFVTQKEVLYLLYILDNFLMGFDVAQTTYLDRIAPKEDLAGSLALGSTINHVTGVTAPIVGGYLWARFGHPATFMLGAAVACASFYVAGKVPRAAVTPGAAAPLGPAVAP